MDELKDTKRNQIPQKNQRRSLVAGIAIKAGNILYFHKRTERVVAAVFIVTELLTDTNPIRQRSREIAVELMSFVVSFQSSFADEGESFVRKYQKLCLEIVSLLEVGAIAEQLTDMNYRLISEEIERLVLSAERMVTQAESFSASSKVGRALEKEIIAPKKTDYVSDLGAKAATGISKGQYKRQVSDRIKEARVSYTQSKPKSSTTANPVSKSSRRSAVLSLLKDGKHLSVKDFSNVIPGVSEKTIQRELTAMVLESVLKKEGERRWTRYFI